MKRLKTYIEERLGDYLKDQFVAHPETKDELIALIADRIEKEGNYCNLNDIDVSHITNMNNLFSTTNWKNDISNFDGDISKWDVSNVTTMSYMFYGSSFTGDISKWNVKNVKNMHLMFSSTKFDGDISNWNVENVENFDKMFKNASKFKTHDLSKWHTNHLKSCIDMFKNCPLQDNFKPKFIS